MHNFLMVFNHFPTYISCAWSHHNHVHHSGYYSLVSLIFGTTIPTSFNKCFYTCIYCIYMHSTRTVIYTYVCLIRPHLEYASQVWNPHLLKDINKIENVQKFALRLCVKQWSQDYESLPSICDLPTLGYPS